MKKNILILSALLSIVSLSSALITAKDKTTTSKRLSKEQIKQQKELHKALKTDNLYHLIRFNKNNPAFNMEDKYSNLIPNIEYATPLMAASYYGAENCFKYLLQKRQVRNVVATDEKGLTALDYAKQQLQTSPPKNKEIFNRIIKALEEAEYYAVKATDNFN